MEDGDVEVIVGEDVRGRGLSGGELQDGEVGLLLRQRGAAGLPLCRAVVI